MQKFVKARRNNVDGKVATDGVIVHPRGILFKTQEDLFVYVPKNL